MSIDEEEDRRRETGDRRRRSGDERQLAISSWKYEIGNLRALSSRRKPGPCPEQRHYAISETLKP